MSEDIIAKICTFSAPQTLMIIEQINLSQSSCNKTYFIESPRALPVSLGHSFSKVSSGGVGRVSRWCWVNAKCRGVLQF